MNFLNRLRKKIWGSFYKNFASFEHLLFGAGLMRKNKGRQPYHVGWFAPGKTLEELRIYLHANWGFGNHFVSFTEKEEVLNWRKITESGRQYHLRVYKDGEIRGHLEYMPEKHPVDHLFGVGEKEAMEDFLRFLGDFVVYEKNISELSFDPSLYQPPAEEMPTKYLNGQ